MNENVKAFVPSRDRVASYVVLTLFLVITALATKYVWDTSRFADRTHFDADVRSILGEISNRMDVYTNVLRAASGLFARPAPRPIRSASSGGRRTT